MRGRGMGMRHIAQGLCVLALACAGVPGGAQAPAWAQERAAGWSLYRNDCILFMKIFHLKLCG